MAEGLSFEAAGHVYRCAGVCVPSVTQVLATVERSFAFIDPAVLEAARAFGSHVHKAIELFNLGELDEEALDPALAPYLAQWKQFLADTSFEVTETEQLVYHSTLRYAGRLDVRGIMRSKRWVIDLKSGAVPRTCQLQTAAYEAASSTGFGRGRRAALQLSPGRYNLIKHEDTADFAYFTSAINLFRWRERHHG